ncbi:MAG: hypothetical protein RJB66_89 [Pseudomonadota bacterium]|jgi:ADP-heptose:LPS heptosyltransferase
MQEQPKKILIIRFSSFGDVIQTLSVASALKNRWPDAEIHWVTRSEFLPLIKEHPAVHQVWSLQKSGGLGFLFGLCKQLKAEKFNQIYDAHNNLRSWFIGCYLFINHLLAFEKTPTLLRRSIRRWKRYLLFHWRIDQFERPFSGQRDLLEPLEKWGISRNPPLPPQLFLSPQATTKAHDVTLSLGAYVALAPSAAYALKRWPLDHWKTLLQRWTTTSSTTKFVLLGGPEDQFLQELVFIAPERIFNLAGKLSLEESAAVVKNSQLLIANDTGLLHVGEQLGHPTIALMGPAPFGFPCRLDSTQILELDLPCRPCSKHGQGPCINTNYQWCLVGITPDRVLKEALQKITSSEVTGSC